MVSLGGTTSASFWMAENEEEIFRPECGWPWVPAPGRAVEGVNVLGEDEPAVMVGRLPQAPEVPPDLVPPGGEDGAGRPPGGGARNMVGGSGTVGG